MMQEQQMDKQINVYEPHEWKHGTVVAGVEWKNPVGTASGTFQYDACHWFYDVSQMGCKFDNMVWNEAATKASEQVLQAMDIPYEYPTDCGSSDVGNVSHQCPAVHVHLALGDVPMPEHSTDIANAVKARTIEPTIVKGAEIMGRLALLFAQDAALRQQMKHEFMSNGLSCNH